MKCTDSRDQLSAYIDEQLTPEEKNLLDDHLKTCTMCRHALEELRKSIALTKGLEELEPPPWLSEKVMTGIRQGTKEKGGIIKKLFFPLHIKLPIEVFATLAIIVTAFYIFKTIGPEVQVTMSPSEEYRAPAGKSKEMTPSELPAPAKRESLQKSPNFEKAFNQMAAPESAGTVYDRADKEAQVVHVSLYVNDRSKGINAVKETIKTLQGTVIRTESLMGKTIISAELEEEKLKLLNERLELLGELEEKELFQIRRAGKILVTIEVSERF